MNADQLEQILENVVRRVYRRELDGLRAQVEIIHQRLDKIAPRKMAAAVAEAESLGDLERRVRLNALDEIRSVYVLWTDGGAAKHPLGDREAARRIGAALRYAGLSVPDANGAGPCDTREGLAVQPRAGTACTEQGAADHGDATVAETAV